MENQQLFRKKRQDSKRNEDIPNNLSKSNQNDVINEIQNKKGDKHKNSDKFGSSDSFGKSNSFDSSFDNKNRKNVVNNNSPIHTNQTNKLNIIQSSFLSNTAITNSSSNEIKSNILNLNKSEKSESNEEKVQHKQENKPTLIYDILRRKSMQFKQPQFDVNSANMKINSICNSRKESSSTLDNPILEVNEKRDFKARKKQCFSSKDVKPDCINNLKMKFSNVIIEEQSNETIKSIVNVGKNCSTFISTNSENRDMNNDCSFNPKNFELNNMNNNNIDSKCYESNIELEKKRKSDRKSQIFVETLKNINVINETPNEYEEVITYRSKKSNNKSGDRKENNNNKGANSNNKNISSKSFKSDSYQDSPKCTKNNDLPNLNNDCNCNSKLKANISINYSDDSEFCST